MSTKSNVYSQGGGGTQYELEVQTSYFINFLIGGNVPGIQGGRIVEYRQQSSSLGFNTDDMLLKCVDSGSVQRKVLFQIKHILIISEKSELFVEVLINSWKDFNNETLFNKLNDKIYLVKNDLTLNEKNHLKQILNWAKVKASVNDFKNEVDRVQSKKNYLELFKSIIIEAGFSVSDRDLFDFFKCFDLLEYDFGNEASTSKAHFLSLLDLVKSDNLESSTGIWNKVFTFISGTNPKGGFFNASNIPVDLTSHFNNLYYAPIEKDLKRFSNQNLEIIKFIEDSIGGVHIDRLQFIQESIEKLNETRFLILSGGPGAGKSAIAKAILESISQTSSGYIISFKADELINKNLRDIFAAFNINITINEVFSHFPLNQDNIIYIDSAEKLLEGEGLGFIQLLASVQNIPNIKFLISCRSSNLNLIERKFFYNRQYAKLDVPVLNDVELDELQIKLPVIQKLRLNKRILPLIKNPKYLDYSVKALSNVDDFSEATEVEFVNKLWEAIVENKLNMDYDGLPLRRNSLFIELAVKRAKAMTPFISLENVDKIALDGLLKESVVVKSNAVEAFSPAHDVLEDWALIRHVSNEFLKMNNDSDFFEQLGTEPAMRRAYRLWVQDSLKEQNNLKVEFFIRSFKSIKLDKFWQDESLIAVLNSSYCQSFFENNLSLFKENNWSLFFRSVHIMRTACRENSPAFHGTKHMVPTGFGWITIINIIHKYITEIPEIYYSLVYHTISDWSSILNTTQNNIEGTREAGLIAIYLHENMFLKYSKDADEDVLVENSLKLIFELCGGIVTEVEGILRKAIKQTAKAETDKNWESRRYHEKILSLSLSGIKSGKLAIYLPDLLIEIAKGYWYEKPRIKVKNQDSIIDMLSEQHSPGDVNHYFGLGNNFDLRYFPSSAYQTPILWLLRNHPIKTIDFICELINVTTQKYAAFEFSEDDGCTEIELIMPDGVKITQTGSIVLWTMYRGTGKVTPYLLQSILMALEYYLFEIADFGDAYKGLLQKVLDQLYFKSKSVATTSVISSLCQAFPVLVGKKLLPLFTNRKLISWDVSRYTGDFHPFNMMFNYDVYELEREKSNKLPHRLKHTPGIKGFIVDYCFNVRLFNKEIFEIIDKHREDAKTDDYEWRKILDDMDVRTWRLTKEVVHDGKTGVMIEPSYSDEIKAYADEAKDVIDESSKNSSYKLALIRAEKEEEGLAIAKWREIYLYYISIKELQFFEHTPGLLAVVGIRDLWNDLNAQERNGV